MRLTLLPVTRCPHTINGSLLALVPPSRLCPAPPCSAHQPRPAAPRPAQVMRPFAVALGALMGVVAWLFDTVVYKFEWQRDGRT